MKSLVAIASGSLFIIIAVSVLQLVALFVMFGYTHLEHAYPSLKDISGIFRYLVAIPVFILVMFIGGYITAALATTYVVILAAIVGVITAVGMLWLALENADLTITGMVLFVLMIIATILGAMYWQKRNLVDDD